MMRSEEPHNLKKWNTESRSGTRIVFNQLFLAKPNFSPHLPCTPSRIIASDLMWNVIGALASI